MDAFELTHFRFGFLLHNLFTFHIALFAHTKKPIRYHDYIMVVAFTREYMVFTKVQATQRWETYQIFSTNITRLKLHVKTLLSW